MVNTSIIELMQSPEFQEVSLKFNEAMDEYQKEADEFWKSFSHDDRLKLFCAMASLMYEGEIVERRTYRGMLYDIFDFGPESYAPAQCAGYMSIHNAIFDGENIKSIIKDFVENYMDVTKDNLDEQIDSFILTQHL